MSCSTNNHASDVLWYGNTFRPYLENLKTSEGVDLTSATVTWALYESDRTTQLGTGSMTNTTGANDYYGTMAGSVFASQDRYAALEMMYTATQAGSVLVVWQTLTTDYRTP